MLEGRRLFTHTEAGRTEIVKGHPLAGLKGIEKVLYLLELRFFVQHPQLLSGVQSLPRA